MKLKLKKPALHNDVVYREDSVIDMLDEGRCKFMIAMGYAVECPKDATLTNYAPAEMPKPITAVDVGEAVAKAISKGMSFPVEKKNA
jgi:hypothetical protein